MEFDEIYTNVRECKEKAEAVIDGSWLPTAKDKQKEVIKRDTRRRKAAEAKSAAAAEAARLRKEAIEIKRGKLAKASGNEQIKLKANQMIKRRNALAKERARTVIDLGRIPYDSLRSTAGGLVLIAAVQYYTQLRVFYLLEGAWSVSASA